MRNKKGTLPSFTDPDCNNSDQTLWKISDPQPFTWRIGNRKIFHMRQHLEIFKSIIDTDRDFKLVYVHDNDMILTDDT